jgi:predicted negative regulator of RcsB-dependent stress response
MKRILPALITFLILSLPTDAQITTPQLTSPRGRVAQQIGVTWVTVDYGRPSVRGRTVWGDVVPYDEVWRAGANETTVFEASTDVTINGQLLKAGRYGLHILPTKEGGLSAEKGWTIIFNGDADGWGSYFYDRSRDVLRVPVTPTMTEWNTEMLTVAVPIVKRSSAVFELRWEKVAIQFEVGVDLSATITENFRRQLTGLHGFTARNYAQAATWMLDNNIESPLIDTWLERAAQGGPDYQTSMLQARIAEKKGDAEKASFHRKQAIDAATNAQLNMYGYELLQAEKYDEAVKIFVLNAERYPKDPNVWDSLGEGYAMAGNKAKAIESFKRSLSMDPPSAVRQNSESWLKKLGGQ